MPARVALLYLGRRGAMPRFTLDLARALNAAGVQTELLLSQHIDAPDGYEAELSRACLLPLYTRGVGALAVWRARAAAREIERAMVGWGATHVIEMMAHIWSPLIADVWRRLGVTRAGILHDAVSHPGDPSALATPWLVRGTLAADRVIALSRYGAEETARRHPAARGKLITLFHPDLRLGEAAPLPAKDGALRVLLMGRLHRYKGVDLFAEALRIARARGANIQAVVRGAGALGPAGARLRALGADIDNRWQSEAALAAALAGAHVVAAPYREASQSGVVSAAFGAGRPVIATPVGALAEQVRDRQTGLVARALSAEAFADCLVELARDRTLLSACAARVAAEAEGRSMDAFARALAAALERGSIP